MGLKPDTIAQTRPPAKLNLFLELLARRDDGYHEIDTVMVPIDWCDQLRLKRTTDVGINLQVGWLPSTSVLARRLTRRGEDARQVANRLLAIPADDQNLVTAALQRFIETYEIDGGFECHLGKSIPAGAGMGGASSDAASALRCAAALCDIPPDCSQLSQIAASIGSDVPFFLGTDGDNPITAARATGRGEQIESIEVTAPLWCVVVYPGVSLSTRKVYADSRVPQNTQTACRFIAHLLAADLDGISSTMMNRLSLPAKKLAPRIDEILESLWRLGVRTCQLTGSGSACFAMVTTRRDAQRIAAMAQAVLEPGAIVAAVSSWKVPAPIELT